MEPISNPHPDGVSDVAQDFRPFLVIYKDGRIHRFLGTDTVPASSSPDSPVLSKDVPISPAVSARLYLPSCRNIKISSNKLPLLVYFHGGGFVIESARSPTYHNYLNLVASEASAAVVSVDYRLAPEHPLPAAFDDSWSAVLWSAASSDPWLADHADLSRVFFAGDSAGATIAHHMALRFATQPDRPAGMDLLGLVLVHPFFMRVRELDPDPKKAAEQEFGLRFWNFLCPGGGGVDHPWINPAVDGRLAAVGAKKALVFVAEKDSLRDVGVWYTEELRRSGWPGEVELIESIGEDHVFHLLQPPNQNTHQMMTKLVRFINNTP